MEYTLIINNNNNNNNKALHILNNEPFFHLSQVFLRPKSDGSIKLKMEFSCSSNRAGASTELSVCSSPSSSYSFSLSEFDQPFTEQQLQAIEAIEAAYQSTTAKRRRENEVLCVSPNSGRRLPRSISSLQSPHSSPLSPCRGIFELSFEDLGLFF